MGKVYYFSTDGTGLDSVADILEEHKGEVVGVEIKTYDHFDKTIVGLIPKIKPGDIVVVDTLDALTSMYRADARLGEDPTKSLWSERKIYLGDKNNWGLYTGAGETTLRHLKNLRGAGASVIVTCHEAERKDETTIPPSKKRGPDVNPDLLGNLIGSSSDVFRLTKLTEPVYSEGGEVVLNVGARLLQLQATDEIMAKYHVPLKRSGQIAPALSRPSYTKLCKHLDKKPSWLTIYGPPGVGKSTFALSMFLDPNGEGVGV
jgi:AAA domain